MRKILVASFLGLLKVRTFFQIPNQKKMAFKVKLQQSFGPNIDEPTRPKMT